MILNELYRKYSNYERNKRNKDFEAKSYFFTAFYTTILPLSAPCWGTKLKQWGAEEIQESKLDLF